MPDQALRHGDGDAVARAARPLVALEEGLVGAVEDEEGRDGEGEEADEAVEEGADGGVRAAAGGLGLERPYREVDGEAEGPACLFEVVDGEFAEGDSLAGADFLVDAGAAGLAVCAGEGLRGGGQRTL